MATTVIKFGNMSTNDFTTYTPYLAIAAASASNYDSFTQVPAGFNLIVCEIESIAAEAEIDLGYGDDAVDDNVAPPTNYATVMPAIYLNNNLGARIKIETYVIIAAEKYPCIKNNHITTPCSVQIKGFLVVAI